MRSAALLAALLASSALGQVSLNLSKGGDHLARINGVVGIGAGVMFFIDGLSRGPSIRNPVVSGAVATGLLVLFLGGGLTAGTLLEPTPPMAWSSFFAGVAGAGLGLGISALVPGRRSFEELMLIIVSGYLGAATIDLLIPGASTLSWKDFWVPMVISVIPGGALIAIGAFGNLFSSFHPARSVSFTALAIGWPVVSFLATRVILAIIQPFDPWYDDLQPPFRAEPFITFTPSGATMGLAANW